MEYSNYLSSSARLFLSSSFELHFLTNSETSLEEPVIRD